jgi:hypothetical protein
MSRELAVIPAEPLPLAMLAGIGQVVIPATVADAGDSAAYRFFEFFTAGLRNPNTRRAYFRGSNRRSRVRERCPRHLVDAVEPARWF